MKDAIVKMMQLKQRERWLKSIERSLNKGYRLREKTIRQNAKTRALVRVYNNLYPDSQIVLKESN